VILAADAAGSWIGGLGLATEEIVDLLLGHTVSLADIEFAPQAAEVTR
jgi:hypothetical protein